MICERDHDRFCDCIQSTNNEETTIMKMMDKNDARPWTNTSSYYTNRVLVPVDGKDMFKAKFQGIL